MTYLDAVQAVNDIERKYDVMSIRYKGISIWPYLRMELINHMSAARSVTKNIGKSAIRMVLATLFYYNPLVLLREYKTWLFAGYERRKFVEGKKILRVSGAVLEAEPRTLVIEKPAKNQSKESRSNVPERYIVSESWLQLLAHALAVVTTSAAVRIENESILKQILSDLAEDLNYKAACRLLISQKRVLDFLLKLCPHPKRVIIECPYVVMGYVWAFHNHKILVIEMQHGVLNNKHYAYNSHFHSKELYPDQLWVFGDDEYRYMKSTECNYCKDVYKTGLYFMDFAKKNSTHDIFSEKRKKYRHIILVAGQRGYEKQMADYVRIIAADTQDCLYLYVPRTNDAGISFSEENIKYLPGVNIYEYMIWCDLHLTISSTTCLECQYYQKPTIFYNFEGMSEEYYGKVLTEDNGVFYTNSASEYEAAFLQVISRNFEFKEVFTPDTVNRIKGLMKSN